jgi:hypothetical protein
MTARPARFAWPPAPWQRATPAARRSRLRLGCRKAACTLLLGLSVAAAHAMSIRELRTLEASEKDGQLYANYYLVGVMEGLREASEAAGRAGRPPPFCIEGRRLEPAMARPLYQAELSRNADSYEADMPVQFVMASALRNSYRCTH